MAVVVETDEPVNVDQLQSELGGDVPMKVIGPDSDGVTRVVLLDTDGPGQKQPSQKVLAQAVSDHQADPEWVDPDPDPPSPEDEDVARYAELRNLITNTSSFPPLVLTEFISLAVRLGRL